MTVQERIGLSYAAAARGLPRLRCERIADLLQTENDLASGEAATRLGYPPAVQHTALATAATELRGRRVQPYPQRIADVLVGAGLAEQQDIRVQHLDGEVLVVAVLLNGSASPALVWDERNGWRTAVSRRHPIGQGIGTPSQGDGIRYLSEDEQPESAELLAARTESRRGSDTAQDDPPGRYSPARMRWQQACPAGPADGELQCLVLVSVEPDVDCHILAGRIARERQHRRALADFLSSWGAAGGTSS